MPLKRPLPLQSRGNQIGHSLKKASEMAFGADPEDLAVVKRLLSKDEEAFARLVDRYHGRLLRVA